jgi:hypothetical protein
LPWNQPPTIVSRQPDADSRQEIPGYEVPPLFEHILIVYDGSESAGRALDAGTRLATAIGVASHCSTT